MFDRVNVEWWKKAIESGSLTHDIGTGLLIDVAKEMVRDDHRRAEQRRDVIGALIDIAVQTEL